MLTLTSYTKNQFLTKDRARFIVTTPRQASKAVLEPVKLKSKKTLERALEDCGVGKSFLHADIRVQYIFGKVKAIAVEMPFSLVEYLKSSEKGIKIRRALPNQVHLDKSLSLIGIRVHVPSRFTGKGVKVAVIDSGIDYNHPDFKGRIILNESHNFTKEGKHDDPMDLNGHGTHVAGIIGGSGERFRGIASEVEFIVLKVFDRLGRGSEDDVMAAVEWAERHDADIINYSGGYAPVTKGLPQVPPPWVWPLKYCHEEQEFLIAMNQGIVAVVSAGNNGGFIANRIGTVSSPATVKEVISVGSVTKDKKISSFSSAGPVYRSNQVSWFNSDLDSPPVKTRHKGMKVRQSRGIDLVAPGGEVTPLAWQLSGCFYEKGIISTLSSRANPDKPCIRQEMYVILSGTSMAAPHVTGIAALYIQALKEKKVYDHKNQAYFVKELIKRGAEDLKLERSVQGTGLIKWNKPGQKDAKSLLAYIREWPLSKLPRRYIWFTSRLLKEAQEELKRRNKIPLQKNSKKIPFAKEHFVDNF